MKFASLGQTWINLLAHVVTNGTPMAEEGMEILGTEVAFEAHEATDAILERFGNPEMIRNMEDVFFGNSPTVFGHSYAELMRGPAGRSDLQDVIELLSKEPWSKRATLTLCGKPNGKVPCINVAQFLVREDKVQTFYFARGQDIFRKFYADGHCISSLTRTVATGLGIAPGAVSGFIGSSHVYHKDMAAIRDILAQGSVHLRRNQASASQTANKFAQEETR